MLRNFALNVVGVAVALWAVVNWVPGIGLEPTHSLGAFAALAVVFVLINSVIAPVLKVLGAPITCATLGLFALVINGAVLLLSEAVFNSLDLGLGTLTIDGWWPAILGAIVLAIVSGAVNVLTSPLRAD